MKFTDLTGPQRSILAMLATSSVFDTKQLGNGVTPKHDAQSAAHLLMQMRELGLIFSSQKLPNQPYAHWRISEYGKAVFEGRPSEDVAPAKPAGTAKFVVYREGAGTIIADFDDEAQALLLAGQATDQSKGVCYVARIVARVKPVIQPTHEIERV